MWHYPFDSQIVEKSEWQLKPSGHTEGLVGRGWGCPWILSPSSYFRFRCQSLAVFFVSSNVDFTGPLARIFQMYWKSWWIKQRSAVVELAECVIHCKVVCITSCQRVNIRYGRGRWRVPEMLVFYTISTLSRDLYSEYVNSRESICPPQGAKLFFPVCALFTYVKLCYHSICLPRNWEF